LKAPGFQTLQTLSLEYQSWFQNLPFKYATCATYTVRNDLSDDMSLLATKQDMAALRSDAGWKLVRNDVVGLCRLNQVDP
jgi:hypothetical protein